ncbi:MAG: VCBS repeat-containing protein [Propionivibrio sp.]
MKIASSALQLESSHLKSQRHEIHESLRSWVGGNRRPDFEGTGRATSSPPSAIAQFSPEAKAAQSNETSTVEDNLEAVNNDPMLRLIRAMISMLTGREVEVFDASELNVNTPAPGVTDPNQSAAAQTQQQPAGYGVEYDYSESYTESEQTTFEATGMVRTEDGKEIHFDLSLSMTRSYHEESNVSIRLGDARQKKDPLVINFGGNAAQLTSQRFSFDLDSDGKTDDINFVTGGSGFLALDRNGDGKINNGSELFGAKSGDGFAELAALDSDHNGWIDENDAAYAKLSIWTKDSAGEDRLATLKQANVGAISLARVTTPFELKNAQNEQQGEIRASGIYLREDGAAGTIQQIDLTV